MRTLNLKGLALLSGIIALGLATVNSCTVDHTLSPAKYAKIYIPQARNSPVEYDVVTGIDSLQVFNYQAVYGGPGKPTHDIKVQFSVDTSLVDSFNIKHFTSYPLLPKSNYERSEERRVGKE